MALNRYWLITDLSKEQRIWKMKNTWNIVHDCDLKVGTPTEWALKIVENVFYWIDAVDDFTLDVIDSSCWSKTMVTWQRTVLRLSIRYKGLLSVRIWFWQRHQYEKSALLLHVSFLLLVLQYNPAQTHKSTFLHIHSIMQKVSIIHSDFLSDNGICFW